jgi:hypothetical protein
MRPIGKLSKDLQKTPQPGSTTEDGKMRLNQSSEPWLAEPVPAPTPNLTQFLEPHDLDAHRARIGVEVEIVLDGYWQTRPSEGVRVGILSDWMDELQDWHIDQIFYALRKWRDDNPSKKPNPGHIKRILKGERGMAWVAQRDGRRPKDLFAIDRPLLLEASE